MFLKARFLLSAFNKTSPKVFGNFNKLFAEKMLVKQSKAGFFSKFWGKKKNIEPEKTEKELIAELNDFSKEKCLSYLIEEIKEKNKKLPPLLPPQDPKFKGKKTVVVEMDNTIIYTFYPDEHEAYLLAPAKDYDYYVDLPEYQTFLSIYLRKDFQEFMAYLKENCEPILFCSGTKAYVDKVMDIVDKDKVFVHRIYQDSCDFVVYPDEDLNEITKDLDRLGRDLSQVILIDSKPWSYWCNPDNCMFLNKGLYYY